MSSQPQSPPRTRRQRSEATTRELIEAARERFAHDGYADTSIDDVVADCQVTKGALYHHFASKAELFEAVYEDEHRRMAVTLTEAFARKRDPWQGFYAGCRAYLDETLADGVRQITMLDAPEVLGWERMRAIEGNYGAVLLRRGLGSAQSAGRVATQDADALAVLLCGALCEAAMTAARAPDPQRAKRRAERELKALLAGLAAG